MVEYTGKKAQVFTDLSEFDLKALGKLLQHKHPHIRRIVAQELGKRPDQKAIKMLIDLFKDEESFVRNNAAYSLTKIGEMALPFLIKALKHSNWQVRLMAAYALSQFYRSNNVNFSSAIEPLIATLTNKAEDRRVRWQVAVSLTWLADQRAIEPLFDTLADCDKSVGYNAALALGQFGDARAIPMLIEALQFEDKERLPFFFTEEVSAKAADLLGKFKAKAAIRPLIAGLNASNSTLRSHAAKALGLIGDREATEALILKLRNDEDKHVRYEAARALGEIGQREAVDALILSLTRDNYTYVRSQAAEALARIGDGRAINPLLEMLDDPDGSVVSSSAWALGDLGARDAVTALIKLLDVDYTNQRWGEDLDATIRYSVAIALGKIGDERALPALMWTQQHDEGIHGRGAKVADYAALAVQKIREAKTT